MDDATPDVRKDVEKAESGDAAAASRVKQAETQAPVAAEAAEQELADGPAGRGLAR